MKPNKLNFFLENIEAGLKAADFTKYEISVVTAQLCMAVKDMDIDTDFPPHIFDIKRSLRIIARQEEVRPFVARNRFLKNPAMLFELFDITLVPTKKPEETEQEMIAPVPAKVGNIMSETLKRTIEQSGDKMTAEQRERIERQILFFEGDYKAVTPGESAAKRAATTQLENFIREVKRKRLIKPPLLMKDIQLSAIATLKETGHRPHVTDGMVLYGPLAGQVKWSTVDFAFKSEDRGLQYSGYKGLIAFMDAKKIPQTLKPKEKCPRRIISLDDIKESIRMTYWATNHRPNKNDGIIEHGPLKGKTSWGNIDDYFRSGNVGLHNSGFKSLRACIESLGIPQNERSAPVAKGSILKPLLLADIKASILETFQATGRMPSARNLSVEYGPLKDTVTWSAINVSLTHGRRGLDGCGFTTLAQLTASLSSPAVRALPPEISAREVFEQCANYVRTKEHRLFPLIGPIVPGLAQVDAALREGRIPDLESIIPAKATKSVVDFMLAAGLLEQRGSYVYTADIHRVEELRKTYA